MCIALRQLRNTYCPFIGRLQNAQNDPSRTPLPEHSAHIVTDDAAVPKPRCQLERADSVLWTTQDRWLSGAREPIVVCSGYYTSRS